MERKLATVLFVDLVGSTELVAARDPEIVRRRVNSFFEHVSHCIATHGGIVEKFAGDAVMAAFGVPQAHEDDAERAIRAAAAILDWVHGLGLEARIGVEAGEIVADERDSTFATGEAVNVAARLQQLAQPGEILIGPFARRLTIGAVETEEVGPVELKGFGEPLIAWRLVQLLETDGRVLSVAASFIGREYELELLENTLARVIHSNRAHLFTIYGEPGVGKSRLAREFIEGVENASVLVGRSLPYGEGVTYWPLAEMVKVAAGITDDDPVQEAISKLRAACGDDAVADLLALAVGVLEGIEAERSQQEIAWAAREWAAELADARPLILVFEDVHWAEEPLLELIEHLAERVKDSPLMILCLARPELLDIRPGWGGGRLRAAAIELEPLGPEESEELLDALLADRELSTSERKTLLEKTEGNPLFVEETTRMLLEGGTAAKRIPDTLQAMIAARIDRLPRSEKRLLQRAAVIGRIFWEGAVAQLLPDVDDLEPVLDDLLLRDFVTRESRSSISGERAYRFKHVLIRDVAYAGLAKAARAELHQQVADWLHRDRRRGARRDPCLPPRPGGDAARGARRRRRRPSWPRAPLQRSRRPAAAPSPARRTTRPGACSCARSSSSRRCSAASSPPEPRGRSPTCRRRRWRWSASTPTRPRRARSGSRASRSPRSPRMPSCATPTCRAGASWSSRRSSSSTTARRRIGTRRW